MGGRLDDAPQQRLPSDDCRDKGDERSAGISPGASAVLFAAAAVAAGAAGRFLWRRLGRPATPSPDKARSVAASAALVREWLKNDPDPETREEVRGWGATQDDACINAVQDRLASSARLRFGTAGLRAEMGAGYARMNTFNVIIATEAVVNVMLNDCAPLLSANGVAVGFDARHNSRKFAVAATAVFVAAGVPVRLFSRPVPTPLVAFSVLEHELAGAVVLTASHNPARDNGYKLFWKDGAQIRPAQAKRIEACMRRKPTERYELDETRLRSSPLVSDLTDACLDAYIAVAAKLRSRPVQENAKSRPVVYTALHGVGYPFVVRLFEAFGLPPVVPVDQQTLAPDPDFPSVAKPNPEERGGKWLYSWHRPPPRSAEVRSDWCHVRCLQALDMAIQRAKGCNATVVLANDPDADRLGVACVDSGTGSVRILTGNEIAALLADFLLLHCPAEKRGGVAMVRSTVSSKMLASMAQKEGFTVMETLTGFKWLSEGAARLAADGKVCLLAYEEALGYMIERGVRDKDGVTAAAVFAELAGHWEAQGRTVGQRMDELYDIYGHHLSHNDYLTITAESTPLAEVFDRARERGMPTVLGRCKVASVRDLTTGTDSAQPDNVALLPKDESTQFLTFTCRSPLLDGEPSTALDDVTISLRGSGTEPKLKWYSEIRVPSAAQRSVGLELLKEAVDDAIRRIVQPELNAYLF